MFAAISSFDAETLKKYPPMDAAPLRRAVAEFYGLDRSCVFAGNGSDDVLVVKEEATIRLWSGIVNKETYAHLMTMLQSRLLYVYDSERDEGWYCTAKTNNAATLPSKNGRSQAFQVELKTINNNEQ